MKIDKLYRLIATLTHKPSVIGVISSDDVNSTAVLADLPAWVRAGPHPAGEGEEMRACDAANIETRLSSETWASIFRNNFVIMDPDGWDRSNFDEDWLKPITFEEFSYKMGASTCEFQVKPMDLFNLAARW